MVNACDLFSSVLHVHCMFMYVCVCVYGVLLRHTYLNRLPVAVQSEMTF